MENRLKSPIYKDGMLFCPYCNSPLLAIEETHLRFKCAVCQRPLGKLTVATLKRMFDDFPKKLAEEWLLEMKEQRKSSSV